MHMTLNHKLAFEIWVGIVVLIIVIGGVAGVTLMLGNAPTGSLVRTQANNPFDAARLPGGQAQGKPLSPDAISDAARQIGSLFSDVTQ